jgi:predicted aconitase
VAANRRARVLFQLEGFSDDQLTSDLLFPLLGTLIGERAGTRLPAIVGLPASTHEDQLKALGAASASSGAVAMFHAVGLTPEAATLDEALQGQPPRHRIVVHPADLRTVRASLDRRTGGRLTAVALGTPHFSRTEFDRLDESLAGRAIDPEVRVYVSTGRETFAAITSAGLAATLKSRGVTILVDTCTYLRPLVDMGGGLVLTNSAKWAWYAPMTLSAEVMIGSLTECVESAVSGRLALTDAF